MKIKFENINRKELVTAIGEILEVKPKYLGMPSMAYEIDYFIVDKDCVLVFDDRADSEEIENLLDSLAEKGFMAKETSSHIEVQRPKESEELGLTVAMPRDYFNDKTLENLKSLIENKSYLIKKALGLKDLPLEIDEEKINFPWFEVKPEDSDTVTAYTHFIYSLCEMARNQKRVNTKMKEVENEKYAFRCFLLRLGFIGDKYKLERKILLQNLSGSSAFKGGIKNENAK